MSRRGFLRASWLFIMLLATVAQARTWIVHADGTGDAPTIQAAIDSAASGDVIELSDGVYVGDGNRDLYNTGNWFLLRSRSGNPEDCIIDCQGGPDDPHYGISFAEDG